MNITIKNMSASYGKSKVLQDLSFSISQGEFLAIAGPNGSGKTTLIRVLDGILPYQGSAVISTSANEFGEISKCKRHTLSSLVSMMPQFSEMYFSYTVKESILLGRYIHDHNRFGSESRESKEKVDAIMEKLRLSDLKDRQLSSLSGGQKQRVMLARTLAQETPIILLDEPTNHLDLKYQSQLMEYLSDWRKEKTQISLKGKTYTFSNTLIGVFHDLTLASSADRILFLKEGKIISDGKTSDVMTSQNLKDIYGMDIADYMKEQLSRWDAIS